MTSATRYNPVPTLAVNKLNYLHALHEHEYNFGLINFVKVRILTNVMKCQIAKQISKLRKGTQAFSGVKCSLRGAPNDGFFLNTLKTPFRQSRVLLHL